MPRVLIVDDNEDLRETYALLLEGEGFDVHGVADGVAGLQAVRCEHPDVVLLDMMMPDLDGLQFLAQLPGACSPPEPRVIATSGFEAYREPALRQGAIAFLQKPIELDVLVDTIRAALAGAPLPARIAAHNHDDVLAARWRDDQLRADLVAELPAHVVDAGRARLRALVTWLQHYYGFGAAVIQLLRGDQLHIEAERGAHPPFVEGFHYPRRLAWCDDVIEAGATVILCDPKHHVLPHFAQHPAIGVGLRFYTGVPLTTMSGAVIGTLCLVDVGPHDLHAEDAQLLEALGRHVAHGLEQLAAGGDASDFVVDADGLFVSELSTLFVQTAVARAARAGATVGVAVVRLVDVSDAGAAARAAYASGDGRGLAVVRAEGDDGIVLVEIDSDAAAHRALAAALHACRDAVVVRSVGLAWCRVPAASAAPRAVSADDELCARLIRVATEASDERDRFPSPSSPSVP